MRLALLLVPVLLAGCASDATLGAASSDDAAVPPDEAAPLQPPTFRLLGAIARTGPVYGGGEPSVAVSPAGAIFVTFPGCDTGPYLVRLPTFEPCQHGLVYRSVDDGATWTRLNGENGRLSTDGPAANNDADVAIDAAGVVYTTNLGAGVQVHRSRDAGDSWEYVGNAAEKGSWSDRQWMAAGAEGHVVVTWMGGPESAARQFAVSTTRDAGASWTNVTFLGKDIGWVGPVEIDPARNATYAVFTEPESSAPTSPFFGASTFRILVARSLGDDEAWEAVDTGARVVTSMSGGHWSGVLMAPALAVTGDGTIVAAWAEETRDPSGATSTGSRIRYVTSHDQGATWSEPATLPARPSVIMPWVAPGSGSRFAITYFASDTPLDADYVGVWDLMATLVDPAGPEPGVVTTTVDRQVHVGGACTRGGLCLLTASDRALLDFFESAVLHDGRLVIAYPADPLQGGKYIEIRVAVQDGGTPLVSPGPVLR